MWHNYYEQLTCHALLTLTLAIDRISFTCVNSFTIRKLQANLLSGIVCEPRALSVRHTNVKAVFIAAGIFITKQRSLTGTRLITDERITTSLEQKRFAGKI